MRRATLFSAALHFLILLLSVFGLPLFSSDWEPPAEAIPVELATVAEMTNIPVRPEPPKKPVEKPEPKPEAKPEPEKPKPAPPPPPPEPEIKPEPAKPEAEPVPVPEAEKVPLPEKAEPKPEPKQEPERIVKMDAPQPKLKPKRKPPEKTEKKEEFDLKKIAALLDKLPAEKAEQAETETQPETPDELPPTEAVRPTTSAQMTLSEIDAIRAQVEQCWSVPAGARYAEDLVVRVRIFLRPDGGLAQPPEVVDTMRMSMPGEEAFRTAAESAVRAIMKCEPFKNLPPEKYDRWREIELNFDPRSMLSG